MLRDSILTRQPGWAFLALWVMSTSIASIIGLIVADIPAMGQSESSYQGDNGIAPLLIWGCGLIFVLGPLLGIAQGVVLWRFGQIERSTILVWVISTAFGIIVAVILGTILGVMTGGQMAGCGWIAIPGASIGGAQWLAARRYWRTGWWWIGANAIGWPAGALAGWLVYSIIVPPREIGLPYLPYYPSQAVTNWAIAWAIGSFVFSLVTGLAYVLWAMQAHRGPKQAQVKSAP
jgi:hypothetical protein